MAVTRGIHHISIWRWHPILKLKTNYRWEHSHQGKIDTPIKEKLIDNKHDCRLILDAILGIVGGM